MQDILEQVKKLVNEARPADQPDPILSDDQVERIILSLYECRKDTTFTEEEAYRVVKWCEDAVLRESLVSLVLSGLLDINWISDEEGPSFKSTNLGQKTLQEFERGLN